MNTEDYENTDERQVFISSFSSMNWGVVCSIRRYVSLYYGRLVESVDIEYEGRW